MSGNNPLDLGIADPHDYYYLCSHSLSSARRLSLQCDPKLPYSGCCGHWRPLSWANREASRTTAAEYSVGQICTIVNPPFFTVSAGPFRDASMSAPSTNSSPGTAPSLGWRSTESSVYA